MEVYNSDFVETVSGSEEIIFAKSDCEMIAINANTYAQVATSLRDAIGDGYYYNGTFDLDCAKFYSTFTGTVIVYRDSDIIPEGRRDVITDLIPVWWEFETVIPEVGSVLNDFNFTDLKRVFLSER